jgi:hypothetical protein
MQCTRASWRAHQHFRTRFQPEHRTLAQIRTLLNYSLARMIIISPYIAREGYKTATSTLLAVGLQLEEVGGKNSKERDGGGTELLLA